MAYTVTQLITNAFKLSGVVSRDFETVSGPQFAEGLDDLNDILADKTSDKSMIPYFQSFDFTSVIGQEAYPIPNLIEATSLVFFLATVRYAMIPMDRDAYFGLPRAQNIESLPFTYHVERNFGGATIYIYFLPQQAYPMQLWGKFSLSSVTLNQDLSLTIDRFYINYLKYQLAQRICNDYNYEVPASISGQLSEYQQQITKKSAIFDLACKKISTLTNQNIGLNYAAVNLGKGWTIP